MKTIKYFYINSDEEFSLLKIDLDEDKKEINSENKKIIDKYKEYIENNSIEDTIFIIRRDSIRNLENYAKKEL